MDQARRARVVVVDDDRFHRELAGDTLGSLADVECCASADEALAALQRAPADLVVSDLTMPGQSGLQLLDAIRRNHAGTDFILVTGNASVESAIEALRKGAIDYLRKPVDPTELSLVVERTLDRRRLLADNTRLRESLAVLEASRALGNCLEPSEVYAMALDVALSVLDRQRGLVLYHRSGLPQAAGIEYRGFPDSQGAQLHHVLAHEKPVPLDEIRETGRITGGAVHEGMHEAGLEPGPLLAVPLHGDEGEGGILLVVEDDRPFDAAEYERIEVIAGHAQAALRNAERYHRAKERAFLDDVTGVYNARYLLEAMDREIRRAERYATELSVLFLDLDRFKQVNDNHGHLVGSQTLRQLSRLLGDCVRQVDTLARYGGDEFTIILVDTDEETGMAVAERIRRTVADAPFDAGRGTVLNLTCSVGLATYPTHGCTREELLEAADKAMYRSKSEGRNRVCSASDLG